MWPNIHVADLQVVPAGGYLGDIGTDTVCGGNAIGAHVHYSLWYFSPPSSFDFNSNAQMKDSGGIQIGSWAVSRGSAQYYGCLIGVISGAQYCSVGPPSWTPIGGPIYNDGTIPVSSSQLAITNLPLSGAVGSSPVIGPITIQLQNATGNPVNAGTGGVPVTLWSSSSGNWVFASSSGGTSINSVTIPAGSTSTNVYYGDPVAGRPLLKASASGLALATQVETITPTVSAVSPNNGPVAGQTVVSITGTGFTASSAVLFGATPASATTYVSATQLQATSPPESSGVVDVAVAANGAHSPPSSTDRFVYGAMWNYRGVSTQQYTLSPGTSWPALDTSKLTLTVVPPATSIALLSASTTLFATSAGANQDLGINVTPTPADCPEQSQRPAVWRESGGALTLRPTAVSMQIACTFQQGTTYTVQLVGRASVSGAVDGAGSVSPFSPTVISANLTPVTGGPLIQSKSVTSLLHVTSKPSWVPMDQSNLVATVSVSSATTALLSANADLFTDGHGNNIDLGLCVTTQLSTCTGPTAPVVAWEEAGQAGSSAWQSMPTAVQASYNFSPGTTYYVALVWQGSANEMYAGTGGADPYSPTVLLINQIANLPGSNSSPIASSTAQYSRDNGAYWQEIDSNNLSLTFTASQDSLAYLTVNASLFNANSTAFNADLGICVFTLPATGCDPAGSTIVAWTESGSGAAHLNPDGSMVKIPIPVWGGKTDTIRAEWRTNTGIPANSGMYSGAGSSSPFSPTSLAAWLVPLTGSWST
jgi:hypothetical protein